MKFGKAVVKCRILILAFALLVPSAIGMIRTRINYDMLTYLPGDIDTVIGQDILMKDFGKGAFSFVIIEGMEPKDVSGLKKDIETIEHVEIGEAEEQICVPFTTVTGMILDNEVFRNVEVSSGKVINDGDKTMVAGIAFPSMARNLDIDEEDLPGYVEVEADVTDFSLETTYCVAMNNLLNNLNRWSAIIWRQCQALSVKERRR